MSRHWGQAMGKPLSWLMMICHRRAIDRVRTEESHKCRTQEYAVRAAEFSSAGGADEPTLLRDEHRQVLRYMATLSTLQQQSIRMVYFDDVTRKESAAHTATSGWWPRPTSGVRSPQRWAASMPR